MIVACAIASACGAPASDQAPASDGASYADGIQFSDGTPAYEGSLTQVDARCTRIIDGDTVVVELDGAVEKVRLMGIDAAERRDETEGTRTLAVMAAERLRILLLNRPVTLHLRPRRDRDVYGRLLAYVHVAGRDAGAALLEEGLVAPYVAFPHPRHQTYAELARTASEDRRGLWALAEQREATEDAFGSVAALRSPYVASWRSEVFHSPGCKHAASISPDNAVGFETREAAIHSGRRPCRRCKPRRPRARRTRLQGGRSHRSSGRQTARRPFRRRSIPN